MTAGRNPHDALEWWNALMDWSRTLIDAKRREFELPTALL
jgi:hypothetical protein